MAFSLICTQRAPTRMWPQAVSKPAVLGEKYFYGRFLGTAEHRTRVSRSFPRPRYLSDGILSGPGADAEIQSSVRQADDRQHRRPNAIRRQREILFCEPKFQQEPDSAYFL